MKTTDHLLVIQSSTNTGCGTGDGASCSVPQNGQPAACGCQSNSAPLTVAIKPLQTSNQQSYSRWQTVRSGVMFVIACVASPCCTPLIVPVLLALLGGTPIAVWIGHNLGVVYGGFTVLSVISLVLALRWMKTDHPQVLPQIQADMNQKPLQSINSIESR